ncbi:hypothetical protein [Candidatus Poriferisocius sp.]|uniref:hypothetical protein n=1 Tax=Candidatus Poriferisocius sp. TaxID=3101276 RepID=UPI003B028308
MAMRFGRDFTVSRSHADDSLSTLSAYLVANHQSTLDRAKEMAAGIVSAAEQTVDALPAQHQVPPLEKMLKRLNKRADECSDTVEKAVRRHSPAAPAGKHLPRQTEQQWAIWEAMFMRPARDLPGLREFLSRPPVFQDE